jgi:hypothetical protein
MNETKTPMTNKEKQSARNAALNEIARAAGWKGWSEFSTAVINGKAEIPQKAQQ